MRYLAKALLVAAVVLFPAISPMRSLWRAPFAMHQALCCLA